MQRFFFQKKTIIVAMVAFVVTKPISNQTIFIYDYYDVVWQISKISFPGLKKEKKRKIV